MMKKLNVTVLTNATREMAPDDPKSIEIIKASEEVEHDITKTLEKCGHHVRVLGIKEDVKNFFNGLLDCKDDIIFNVCESFRNDSMLEMHVAAVLELVGLKYTGCGPTGLLFAQDKGITKKILAYHGIKFPAFAIYPKGKPVEVRPSDLRFPLIVKPLHEDSSIGISGNSLVKNDETLKERVEFVHEKLSQDALVEEYIEGREFYVGVLGFEDAQVLPIIEMDFSNFPKDRPKIASFKAKWDPKYREEKGIKSFFPKDLPGDLISKISEVALTSFKALQLRDYARLDLRVTPDHEVYVLEANPNPYIAEGEDLPEAAAKAGISYSDFLELILDSALKRHRKNIPPPKNGSGV
ncbi:MAG: ATP-grasp domain-containing protein [Chlamydiae bacterium]|nr:ATP-grasp domain-containing protein [Chlamydiota bacterium]MBI3267299.1 ATP-grasp domain-containing protein [Chlamydiota bacterium]